MFLFETSSPSSNPKRKQNDRNPKTDFQNFRYQPQNLNSWNRGLRSAMVSGSSELDAKPQVYKEWTLIPQISSWVKINFPSMEPRFQTLSMYLHLRRGGGEGRKIQPWIYLIGTIIYLHCSISNPAVTSKFNLQFSW